MSLCPETKASEEIIIERKEITYLSTIISADGKPDSDILRRYNKGISAGDQIIGMLNENFSFSYFKTAMTFRNSLLVNGVQP